MRFSRDNIIISNRCGEYLNAQKYFGFLNMTDQNIEVSLWFVNSLDENQFAAPCGFTSGTKAKLFLQKVIEFSRKKLDEVFIEDEAKKGQKYVSKKDYNSFKNLIIKAENIDKNEYANEIYDYVVYLLYLGNFGSQSDIGAQYAGYNYVGLDNQIKIKE